MVTLTELAASKVKTSLERRGQGVGIRIGVKTTGCSGLAYVLEFVDKESSNDLKFTIHDVDIFVDPKSLVYIDGIIMDWQKRGLNEGFEFINPQEKDRCGCGESFRV
jgi:iron-sulfur cluster assembly protein